MDKSKYKVVMVSKFFIIFSPYRNSTRQSHPLQISGSYGEMVWWWIYMPIGIRNRGRIHFDSLASKVVYG